MKLFLKENSYDIVKLYITQIGITIFSLIMYTACGMIDGDGGIRSTIEIAISVFATLFFYILLYTAAWDWGAKDKIRVDGGRLVPNKAKALLMALIAAIPNLLLSGLAAISFFFCLVGVTNVFIQIGTVTSVIMRFTSSMYQGLLYNSFQFMFDTAENAANFDFYLVQACGYMLMTLLGVLATHLGYIFGLNDKKIFGFIKTKPKKYE